MVIEKSVNEYGQEQIIHNADRIIKIEGKFLQVRLIETRRFRRQDFTPPMPRARFVGRERNPYYLIRKSDLIKLRRDSNDRKNK